jgi:hypothetical protein
MFVDNSCWLYFGSEGGTRHELFYRQHRAKNEVLQPLHGNSKPETFLYQRNAIYSMPEVSIC